MSASGFRAEGGVDRELLDLARGGGAARGGLCARGLECAALAIFYSSTVPFFLGTALAGVGFGAGFQGALRTVVPLAQPYEPVGLRWTLLIARAGP